MTTPASSPLQELEALIRAGAARRWPSPLPEAVRARLDEELAWLRAKPEAWHQAFLLACNRFASARELDAAIPCRGAAAGSAIAYALGLTDLDPLAHGLRTEPFFFRAAPTFPLETDTKVAIDVRQWARIPYATDIDSAQLLGVDDENAPEHSDVQDALDELRRRLDVFRKVGHPIDLAAIPLDDPLTFKAFATGNTDGIPAFQSFPMLAALRGIRPRTLNDLALLYTLTLPGPCLFYNDFLHRRNTFAKTPSARAESAPHPSADAQRDNLPAADEPSHMGMDAGSRPAWLAALAETHGILLWQEQVLTLLRDLAGFDIATAWVTLRALLKDKYTTLRRVRPRFIKGALANPTFTPALPALRTLLPGFTDEPTSPDSLPTDPKALAQRLWDDLLFFASTLYPKSHALARSLLAYRLLYLRLHNTLTPAPCPPPKRPTERPILDP